MLKLEDQVCSLELAKKLKALNCKQDSLFYWTDCGNVPLLKNPEIDYWKQLDFVKQPEKIASAFTVAELGEILPDVIEGIDEVVVKGAEEKGMYVEDQRPCLKSFKGSKDYWVGYTKDISAEEKTEANARAKCLIYLFKEK